MISRARSVVIVAFAWVAGLLMAFHPTLLSGFRLMQRDLGDTRFNNYLLEHHWQWIVGAAGVPSFWDPAMGFPLSGGLGYSDIMLTFAPFYWVWRLFSIDPETSFQLWTLAIATTNYAAMWLLLRRMMKFDVLAATFGAFVFAFAAARIAQLGHAQLMPQFYVLGVLASAMVLFGDSPRGDFSGTEAARRDHIAIGSMAACICAQFWGGFYVGYFAALIAAVALALGLGLRAHRASILEKLRVRAASICMAGIASIAVLSPLVLRYLAASAHSWKFGVGAGEKRLPRLASYLFVGPDSVVYGWMANWPVFRNLPEAHEQAIGLGLVTTAVLLYVAWQRRHHPVTRFTCILIAILFVALTWFPFEIRLWRLWYYSVPGLAAIRAVSRIGLFLLIPAAIALAWWVHSRGTLFSARVALLVALACCLEQGIAAPAFDKHAWQCRLERIAAEVDRDSQAFYLLGTGSGTDNLDALLVSQRIGIPTINFYSGRIPKVWTLSRFQHHPATQTSEIEEELIRYLETQKVSPESVQVLRQPDPERCEPNRELRSFPLRRRARGVELVEKKL